VEEKQRCPACRGVGGFRNQEGAIVYCYCVLGRDLEKVEAWLIRPTGDYRPILTQPDPPAPPEQEIDKPILKGKVIPFPRCPVRWMNQSVPKH
jgi:hypothetical protein